MTEQTPEQEPVPYTSDVRAQALINNLLAEVGALLEVQSQFVYYRASVRADLAQRDDVIHTLSLQVVEQQDAIANLHETLDLQTQDIERYILLHGPLESEDQEGSVPVDRIGLDEATDLHLHPDEKPLYQPSWESEPLAARHPLPGEPQGGSFGPDLIVEPAEPHSEPSGH